MTMTAVMDNTHYLNALKGVVNNMNKPLFGWSYHATRAIFCFTQQRLAATTLIEASLHFLRATKPIKDGPESHSYFMWLLSCLQSMILFDNYPGNKASFSVIFGDDDLKNCEGILAKLIRNRSNSSSKLKINYHQLRNEAKQHLKEIERYLKLIAKQVRAHNNGINFAIKIKTDSAANRFLWPVDSNYNRGTEFILLKELNGGCFPTTQKAWINLIEFNVIPKFVRSARVRGEEIDEDGRQFIDYSINQIRKMM